MAENPTMYLRWFIKDSGRAILQYKTSEWFDVPYVTESDLKMEDDVAPKERDNG